jgi:predicted Zn finger-like uncharacterized protein
MQANGDVDAVSLLRAFVLARLLLFMSAGASYMPGIAEGVPLYTWTAMLFLMDIPTVILVWGIRPGWEDIVRVYVLVWTLVMTMIVLIIAWGLTGAIYIQILNFLTLIAAARPFTVVLRPRESIVEHEEKLLRARCPNCGAVYAYKESSVSEGSLKCQNCGKVFKVETTSLV